MSDETPQLEEWRGHFGSLYHNRNRFTPDEMKNGSRRIGARIAFWHHILGLTPEVKTLYEPGCGTGNNFIAMQRLGDRTKDFKYYGSEPHPAARLIASNWATVADDKLPNWGQVGPYDLAYTMGVLIHVPPADIKAAIKELFTFSAKYILMAEYFAPTEEEHQYHERDGMLWKRDYGTLLMDEYPVDFVSYGFCWKPVSGLDNLTWWLFKKRTVTNA